MNLEGVGGLFVRLQGSGEKRICNLEGVEGLKCKI
jgi:hypothetical protein